MNRFTEKELKQLMKGFTIISDTRENQNLHILSYLNDKKKPYIIQKLDSADYACKINACPELGVMRDVYPPALVERKANWDEICSNLSKASETRFINEFIRTKEVPLTLLLEDANGYQNLLEENYRSKYKAVSLLGRINTLKARYNFEVVYLDPKYSGNYVWHHLYYQALNYLKNMEVQIYKREEPTI